MLETKLKASAMLPHVAEHLIAAAEGHIRPGTLATPRRFAAAWKEWTAGYDVDVPALMTTFQDGASGYDEMVWVRDIPFYSLCEHHLAPFFGTATIAYIPVNSVLGLSKFARLTDAFAKRLQVQERMTAQIADAIDQHLAPIGVGVIVKARHLCMESRGICKQGHHTVTSALRGKFKTDPAVRSEFIQLSKGD